MKYILIIYMLSSNGKAVEIVDPPYPSREACEQAGKAAKKEWPRFTGSIETVCIPAPEQLK